MEGNASPAHPYARDARCPPAEQPNPDGLSLPFLVGLTEGQRRRVIEVMPARPRAESR
jgi:hypothetical protein